MNASGHFACPPSRRGHTWRELTALFALSEIAIDPAPRTLAELRMCRRCGEVGRVSSQGIVVATGTRVDLTATRQGSR